MVYLINPYISSAERYGKEIGDIGGHQMPLGIYYLAAYLLKEKVDVKLIDAEAFNMVHEDVLAVLKGSDTSIVGITSTTVAFRNARSLAEMIRMKIPEVKIVIGGPHMTAMPKETMATRVFDYGLAHEGEISFSKLVQYILNNKGNITDIPNLYWLDNGEVKCNRKGEYIDDMDMIPFPARHLCPDLSVYAPPIGSFMNQPVLSMITSRGCPYQCIFCDNNTFGRRTRFFSAEYVVSEIKQLVNKYGIKEIAFLDDTFVLDKERLQKIFAMLKRDNIKISWTCMTRVNNIDFNTLKMMKENGCWQIRFGIESGNQEVLKFIKKGITLEQVRNVTNWCKQLKIMTTGFFIIGHHVDTPETIQQTIEFAVSLPLTDVTVTINTPIPGTESYNIAKLYGTYNESDWTSLNYWTPVFIPNGLTKEFLLKKQAEFYRRFYLRPSVLVRQLSKIRSFKVLHKMLKSALLGLIFIIKGNKGK